MADCPVRVLFGNLDQASCFPAATFMRADASAVLHTIMPFERWQ